MLNISFEGKDLYENEAIVVLINDQLKIDNETMALDQKYHSIISKTIVDKNRFEGKLGQTIALTAVDKDGKIKHLIIIGIGNESSLSEYQVEELGGIMYSKAKAVKSSTVGFDARGRIGNFSAEQVAPLVASGALLAAYRFDKYFTKQTEQEKFVIKDLLLNE
jgi:leucyl aminopeptidase